MSSLLIGVTVILAVTVYFYNKFIVTRNRCLAAWADVDVQLVRRHELIPNLVRTVKGYSEFETRALSLVTLARSYKETNSVTGVTELEQQLNQEFSTLFALAENYPELKANQSFSELSDELVETEDQIQHARRYYNGTVRTYNTVLQQFPNSLIAKLFQFKEKSFFSLTRPDFGLPIDVDLQ